MDVADPEAHERFCLNSVWESGSGLWEKRVERLQVDGNQYHLIQSQSFHLKCNDIFAANFIYSQNSIRNGAYPAHMQSLWIIVSIMCSCSTFGLLCSCSTFLWESNISSRSDFIMASRVHTEKMPEWVKSKTK